MIVRARRYRLMARVLLGEERIGAWTMLCLSGIRNIPVDLLPARLGEVVFVELLRRNRIPLPTAVTTFGVCVVIDIAVVLLMGSLLFIVFPAFAVSPLAMTVFIVIAIGFFAFILVLDSAVGFVHRTARSMGLHERVVGFLLEVSREVPALRRSRSFIELLLLTVILRLLKYGSLYVLLVGTVEHWGVPVSSFHPSIGIGAFLVAELSASLPASGFLGFGLYEGTWATVFSLSGASLSTSALIGIPLTVHILTQFVGYVLGALSILGLVVVARSCPNRKS